MKKHIGQEVIFRVSNAAHEGRIYQGTVLALSPNKEFVMISGLEERGGWFRQDQVQVLDTLTEDALATILSERVKHRERDSRRYDNLRKPCAESALPKPAKVLEDFDKGKGTEMTQGTEGVDAEPPRPPKPPPLPAAILHAAPEPPSRNSTS